MVQYRRIAAIVVGAWLGAGAFADYAATRNFDTIERFLREPGSNMMLSELTKIGADRIRPILRRNAAEENGFLFDDWETVELIVGVCVIGLLFVGGKRSNLMISLAGVMLFIVAAQRVYLSPQVTELGRRVADLPANDPLNSEFWKIHNLYSGLEVLKIALGLALCALLVLPKKREESAHRGREPELIAGKKVQGV